MLCVIVSVGVFRYLSFGLCFSHLKTGRAVLGFREAV